MVDAVQVPLASGLAESFTQVVPVVASLLVVLMLVALGTFIYKQVRGGGVEWPDDDSEPAEDELRRGGDDDEWKYY